MSNPSTVLPSTSFVPARDQFDPIRVVYLISIHLATVAVFWQTTWAAVGLCLLLHAVIGTTLVATGTNALNQLFERDVDALMRRTERRPLAAGRLSVVAGAIFGWGAGAGGIAWLAWFTNGTTAALAARLQVSEAAREWLALRGYDEQMGARPIERSA